jgi:hypothetical protein
MKSYAAFTKITFYSVIKPCRDKQVGKMLCRIQVQKIIKWSFALAFVIAGIVVLCTMGSSLPVIGVGILFLGGGMAIANATLLEEDIRYRRQYL